MRVWTSITTSSSLHCLGAAATDLGIETAAEKRRRAACQWKRIWKGRRIAKRVNRLCKMNSEAQKLTMTGIHLVQIYGHTAQGASNAQVYAMCRSLKLGTVLGKTQACPITTVAWFFSESSVYHKLLPGLSRSASGFQCGEIAMSTQDAESAKFGGKRPPMLASNPRRWNQANRTYLGHHLLGVGSWMEAELIGFLADTGWQCHSGLRFVQQGADHRQFLQ